ncbi:MAG: VWA domain-containing protein [Acidobacteriales bacterium]|nr:VWA domain-containing protein [Terriglobales bacterium]
MSSVAEASRSFSMKHLATVLILLSTTAFAGSPVRGDREAYFAAANQPKMQDRLRELELFASSTETTDLKIHALELMAWYQKQLGAETEANRWARQLLTYDAENPLGLSVLVENARRANPTTISPETLGFAQRGLRRAERYEKPDALPHTEFVQLRQRMLGVLNGTLGYFHFQQKDYGNARTYLPKALTYMPDDTYYVYALALANLEDKGGDQSEGYWYLARTVNLTQGTPAGKQLADYASARYQQAGGSASNWKQFLAAAAAPVAAPESQPTVSASATTPASQPSSSAAPSKPTAPDNTTQRTEVGSATVPRAPISSATSTPAPSPASTPPSTSSAPSKPSPAGAPKGTQVARATVPRPPAAPTTASPRTAEPSRREPASEKPLPQSDAQRAATAARTPTSTTTPQPGSVTSPQAADPRSNTTEVASLTTPPPAIVPRPPVSPRDPVSLGILIETSIATQGNRSAVIYALVDMVRHLRNADEAFILSFGQQLEFHQDLTQNYDLLEQAMSSIAPAEGAALLDAVGFSSGHLARIARNRNRVLLVISDGSDFGSRTPAHENLRQIDQSGVRVFCIGVGAMDSGGRSRLQQLAARSGGRTAFVADPLHFRAAARQIAAGLGLDFPM